MNNKEGRVSFAALKCPQRMQQRKSELIQQKHLVRNQAQLSYYKQQIQRCKVEQLDKQNNLSSQNIKPTVQYPFPVLSSNSQTKSQSFHHNNFVYETSNIVTCRSNGLNKSNKYADYNLDNELDHSCSSSRFTDAIKKKNETKYQKKLIGNINGSASLQEPEPNIINNAAQNKPQIDFSTFADMRIDSSHSQQSVPNIGSNHKIQDNYQRIQNEIRLCMQVYNKKYSQVCQLLADAHIKATMKFNAVLENNQRAYLEFLHKYQITLRNNNRIDDQSMEVINNKECKQVCNNNINKINQMHDSLLKILNNHASSNTIKDKRSPMQTQNQSNACSQRSSLAQSKLSKKKQYQCSSQYPIKNMNNIYNGLLQNNQKATTYQQYKSNTSSSVNCSGSSCSNRQQQNLQQGYKSRKYRQLGEEQANRHKQKERQNKNNIQDTPQSVKSKISCTTSKLKVNLEKSPAIGMFDRINICQSIEQTSGMHQLIDFDNPSKKQQNKSNSFKNQEKRDKIRQGCGVQFNYNEEIDSDSLTNSKQNKLAKNQLNKTNGRYGQCIQYQYQQ